MADKHIPPRPPLTPSPWPYVDTEASLTEIARKVVQNLRVNIQEPSFSAQVTAPCGHRFKVVFKQSDTSPKVGVMCPGCDKTYTFAWGGWPTLVRG